MVGRRWQFHSLHRVVVRIAMHKGGAHVHRRWAQIHGVCAPADSIAPWGHVRQHSVASSRPTGRPLPTTFQHDDANTGILQRSGSGKPARARTHNHNIRGHPTVGGWTAKLLRSSVCMSCNPHRRPRALSCAESLLAATFMLVEINDDGYWVIFGELNMGEYKRRKIHHH
jgi:hypothetical protein